MTDYDRGAIGFDQVFGKPMSRFVPTLISMAHITPGHRVLDVAAGTGISTELVVLQIGKAGRVVATDISPAMIRIARLRLARFGNVIISMQDGQNLTFPDGGFDAVICSMALHIFTQRLKALQNFRDTLRDGGYAAVSVNTSAEQSITGRLNRLVAQHHPARSGEMLDYIEHHYSLGDPAVLFALFVEAGFHDVKTVIEERAFEYASFDAYFELITKGGSPWGADYMELNVEARQLVKQTLQQEMQIKNGQPFEITVAVLYGSGQK